MTGSSSKLKRSALDKGFGTLTHGENIDGGRCSARDDGSNSPGRLI